MAPKLSQRRAEAAALRAMASGSQHSTIAAAVGDVPEGRGLDQAPPALKPMGL
jgi:hypothetical protein